MNYKDLFNSVLLEFSSPPSGMADTRTPNGTPRTARPRYDDPDGAISSVLDKDTDPDAFLSDGIKQTFDAVQDHFNTKMTNFANTLSPEAVKTMAMGQLKDRISDVFKFVNKINVYAGGKIDQISQDPYAIMAAFLASEPTKMSAFEELHSNLDDFQSALTEIEGQLSALKGKIDDFVADVEEIDAESAAQNIERGQVDQNAEGPSLEGDPSLGLSA